MSRETVKRGAAARAARVPAPIVLIEPDLDVRSSIRGALERAGWTVTEDLTAVRRGAALVIMRLGSDSPSIPGLVVSQRGAPLLILAQSVSPGLFSTAFQLGACGILTGDTPLGLYPVIVAAHVMEWRSAADHGLRGRRPRRAAEPHPAADRTGPGAVER